MLPPGSIRNLCWFAAACFLASWFLPAASEVPGWMAFRYAFSPLWPYAQGNQQGAEDVIPQVASALTNVAFVVMFIMIMAEKVRRPGLFFRITIICFVVDLYWFAQLLRDGSVRELWIGYYVWLVAFALLMLIGWMLMRMQRASRPP
jgi:hypothetical protein